MSRGYMCVLNKMPRDCTEEPKVDYDVQSLFSRGIQYMERNPFSIFSEAEQAYAISQLDPFHDAQYRLTGAPSDQNADSVVLCVNQEKVVSADTFGLSTAAGDKWDLHVSMFPLSDSSNFYYGYPLNSFFIQTSGDTSESFFNQIYPCTATGVVSGDQTYVSGCQTVGFTSTLTSFFSNLSSNVKTPRMIRVIGNSFEVVDETPNLYKQGAVTVYKRPACPNTGKRLVNKFVANGATSYTTQSMVMDVLTGPPNNIEATTILPSSKTWKASQGAYVVAKQTTFDNPFTRPCTSNAVIYQAVDPANPTTANCLVAREGFNQMKNFGDAQWADADCSVTPYNVSGAYFTGLSSQYGTYRIRSKLFFEFIPDPSDTTLITQATPTLPRNYLFEKALSEIIAKLPPGVPQTDNPGGEAWKKILKTSTWVLRKLAPAADMIIPGSGNVAEAIATGIDTTSNAVSNMRKKNKKKKKASPKSPGTVLGKPGSK